jgi:hypothetical protein
MYMLSQFGIFCSRLVFFPCFGMLYQEKSGNPGPLTRLRLPVLECFEKTIENQLILETGSDRKVI